MRSAPHARINRLSEETQAAAPYAAERVQALRASCPALRAPPPLPCPAQPVRAPCPPSAQWVQPQAPQAAAAAEVATGG